MTLLRKEFPDYDADGETLAASLAAIGFEDTSWHNDATPSFEGKGLHVWADYEDHAKREFPHLGTRFLVTREDDNRVGEFFELLATDDVADLLKFLEAYSERS